MHDLDPFIDCLDLLRAEDILEKPIEIFAVTLEFCYDVTAESGLVGHRVEVKI